MSSEPTVIEKSFSYSGAAARDIAAFLGFPMEKMGTLQLELPDYLSNSTTTEPTRNRATWDPQLRVLTFEGRWYDWHSAHPRRAGPRYSFDAPRDLDQKTLSIFKDWARLNQRIQGTGKPVGHHASELRRRVSVRMESDAERKGSRLGRMFRRWFKRGDWMTFESLLERNGRGLWIEVRVGPWIK